MDNSLNTAYFKSNIIEGLIMGRISETITENIFREYYGSNTFIEKSAIPKEFGFTSKKGTKYDGYPDFLLELEDYIIIVEAKSINHTNAQKEVQHYIMNNKITKDIIGIAISGQTKESIKADYYSRINGNKNYNHILCDCKLLTLVNIDRLYWRTRYGESVTTEHLTKILNELNKKFNDGQKVRDTDRSLFFSGLMIALKDNTFRSTYKNIQKPSQDEIKNKKSTIVEAYNLNNSILSAITRQLENKINNMSKEYSWKDKFSFIKNVDYSLLEYKEIIEKIENNIYKPFQNNEKQDILAKAYKIFLSRSGKIDNKNIILTPDHIKNLMIKLARLTTDDVVLDTCTGTGGFLMEAMEDMIEKSKDNDFIINRIKEKQLIGFEVDSVLFALACSNMFLHGDGRTNLLFRSSLLNDKNENIINNKDIELLNYIKNLKPTACIINPPYENNNPIKFAIQALNYLEKNGKLIIIMPTPTLTKNQNNLTVELLKIAKFDFRIRMPYNLFSEQKRSVNTSIFGFTKTPHDKNDDVMFYNMEDDGYVSIQHKGRVDKFDKWTSIKESVLDSILNKCEKIGISEKKKIYNGEILNCAGISLGIKQNSKMIKFKDLFKSIKGRLASDDGEEGEYDFITGSEEWKKHNVFDHNKEAIVYVVNSAGSLGRSHYVNGKFIASNLCLVLSPANTKQYPVNLLFYSYYFNNMRKKMVSDLSDGTSKLTINKTVLGEYYIDYVDIEEQNNFVETIIKPYIEKRNQLKNIVTKNEELISNTMDKLL